MVTDGVELEGTLRLEELIAGVALVRLVGAVGVLKIYKGFNTVDMSRAFLQSRKPSSRYLSKILQLTKCFWRLELIEKQRLQTGHSNGFSPV